MSIKVRYRHRIRPAFERLQQVLYQLVRGVEDTRLHPLNTEGMASPGGARSYLDGLKNQVSSAIGQAIYANGAPELAREIKRGAQ